MAIYTISDLHLSFASHKPMDVFGGNWEGYHEKIERNFRSMIEKDDTVVIGGDISWAKDFSELLDDFKFLDSLPGNKILLKGNHDIWWQTVTKMEGFLEKNDIKTIKFLHNNAYLHEGVAICGTRGWGFEQGFKSQHDKKVFNRELIRLSLSLSAASAYKYNKIYCFLHYPPLFKGSKCTEIIDIMKEFGVNKCIFGHMHGESFMFSRTGMIDGIEFILVSSDYIDFKPVLL